MGATPKSKRDRRIEVAKKERACSICPPNRGENANRRPRSDRHKDARRIGKGFV